MAETDEIAAPDPALAWRREAVRRILRLVAVSSGPLVRHPPRRNENGLNTNLSRRDCVWLLDCTVRPTPQSKHRLRCSLGTRDVEVARVRRDELLAVIDRLAAIRPILPLGQRSDQGTANESRWIQL